MGATNWLQDTKKSNERHYLEKLSCRNIDILSEAMDPQSFGTTELKTESLSDFFHIQILIRPKLSDLDLQHYRTCDTNLNLYRLIEKDVECVA
jgi:hypothetical protein